MNEVSRVTHARGIVFAVFYTFRFAPCVAKVIDACSARLEPGYYLDADSVA